MAKKRRTRQEKIITQLKRELNKRTKFKPSQEAISQPEKIELPRKALGEKTDSSVFSSNLVLIKKDLLKTLILSLIVFSLEFVLYLKLR